MKKFAAAFAGLLTAATLLSPFADARPVVNQGDRVFLKLGSASSGCTVGYVDHARNQAVVSRHCVNVPFQPVHNAAGQRIGTVVSPSGWTALPLAQNDFAYFTLDGAAAGANKFSGNAKVHPSHVRPGEEVCTVGATTQRQLCGRVKSVRGHIVTSDIVGTGRGDSGGPMWIPGRGLVGVHSGHGVINGKYWLTAHYPELYIGPELMSRFSADLDVPSGSSNTMAAWYLRQIFG